MRNLKKMSIDEIQKQFQEIPQKEQMVYIGKTKWVITSNGEIDPHPIIDGYNEDTILALDGAKVVLPMGTVNNSDKALSSGANAKNMFEFLAEHSNAEWAMIKKTDGSFELRTDGKDNRVGMGKAAPSNVVQYIHSHTPKYGGDLSDADKENAGRYSGITHTLYYNGSYRDYGYGGFYGEEYY